MKFQSMSLIAGTSTCNAACPFCVSKMTGMRDVEQKPEEINGRNFRKACTLAHIGGVTSVIITGKGEPTLYPEQITAYLRMMRNNGFEPPFIELQTNAGILAMDEYRGENVEAMMETWYEMGLTTILISNVGYDAEKNRKVYFPKQKQYLDLFKVIHKIQQTGLNVRLTTVGLDGHIDSPTELEKLLQFARLNKVQQVSWRPVNKPVEGNSADESTTNWIKVNGLSKDQIDSITSYVKKHGTQLYSLVHGAAVYDLHGQNLCLTNCLTHDPTEETIRQLIFFPNGKLCTDWQFEGSILL